MGKRQMTEKEKIVALTNLEDGWKINDVDKLQEKQVTSVLILQEEVKRLWCMGTPLEVLKKLSDSMPRRLQCVIDAGGEMTKYLPGRRQRRSTYLGSAGL